MTSAKTNWRRARKRFGLENSPEIDLHHKDPTLRYTDRERYDEWRDEDLEPIPSGEHKALHNKLLYSGEGNPMYGKENKWGHHTEETKARLSEMRKGDKNPMYGKQSPFYGKHHSEESNEKNRQAHLGKKHSEESKKKMSAARKGTKRSEETKAKMAAARRLWWENKKMSQS